MFVDDDVTAGGLALTLPVLAGFCGCCCGSMSSCTDEFEDSFKICRAEEFSDGY